MGFWGKSRAVKKLLAFNEMGLAYDETELELRGQHQGYRVKAKISEAEIVVQLRQEAELYIVGHGSGWGLPAAIDDFGDLVSFGFDDPILDAFFQLRLATVEVSDKLRGASSQLGPFRDLVMAARGKVPCVVLQEGELWTVFKENRGEKHRKLQLDEVRALVPPMVAAARCLDAIAGLGVARDEDPPGVTEWELWGQAW